MNKSLSIHETCENNRPLFLIANDCQQTFETIFNRYRNPIYKTALRYLKCTSLAQEVVQDVFLKLWLHRKIIAADTPIERWLFTVAKNNVFNRLKKLANEYKVKKHLETTNKEADNSTLENMQAGEEQVLLIKALNQLSDQQQTVYRLARDENYSYLEIAKHLDISPLTVKTHMSRALNNLKTFYATRYSD